LRRQRSEVRILSGALYYFYGVVTILTRIAEVCAQSLRPKDVIGRFGGEEFVVAWPYTSPGDAQAVAQTKEDDLDALITRAADMLYKGKRDGRNRVVM
ncbi:diguanylate cyclase domain-containing protein, partial [Pseudidiomarina sp.]|uniref:diguanylate cyclase domain-containing protein n=1 Tax=Pseudidiomarina sp. TaxID=2081707 RepID=UPI00299CF0D7